MNKTMTHNDTTAADLRTTADPVHILDVPGGTEFVFADPEDCRVERNADKVHRVHKNGYLGEKTMRSISIELAPDEKEPHNYGNATIYGSTHGLHPRAFENDTNDRKAIYVIPIEDDSEDDEEPTILTDGGVETDHDADQPLDDEVYDDAKPATQQAIESAEATDRDHIVEALPADIRSQLTKRAFSPGSMRKLLIDTYYAGPIGIGIGGWRGIYGGGQPGTEMRRPDGALYNFPRSWRYAALERALTTGIITHVGAGDFTATARGVKLLSLIDRCPEHDEQRIPMIRTSGYQRSPTSHTVISRKLTTQCPTCGGNGYGDKSTNSSTSYKEYERSDAHVERLEEQLADSPDARVYGLDRPVTVDLTEVPEVDTDEIDATLDEHVENFVAGSPAEFFNAYDEDQHGRTVITRETDGANYRFAGFDEAVMVSRRDATGDVHFTLGDDGRLSATMSYDTAQDGAKEDVKVFLGTVKKYAWDGENKEWLLEPDALPTAVGNLTKHVEHEHGDDKPAFEVTVSPEAINAVVSVVPMLGVESDGSLL